MVTNNPIGPTGSSYICTTPTGLNGPAGNTAFSTSCATTSPNNYLTNIGAIGSSAGLIYNGGVALPLTPNFGEQDVTITLHGKNPKIKCDDDMEIDLTQLSELLQLFKALGDNQLGLPFPDMAKQRAHEILRVQWQELMELTKQYKITEALLDRPTKEEK